MKKLAEFTNANFFTTQTMNGTGVTPINSDGYYRKPLLHELDYDASDFTYYKLLPDGNKIKMAKDKIYFASRGNPYIDHECVKSQASLLVPNIIWAGINVVRLFIPKFDVTIKSVAADGEIKGTVKTYSYR
ncbi:MAG: hypothetical protein H6613_17795 [Ignavibacteriales bacterium]|nr:hypothetical protein [Ignavibacteriales bacterium]